MDGLDEWIQRDTRDNVTAQYTGRKDGMDEYEGNAGFPGRRGLLNTQRLSVKGLHNLQTDSEGAEERKENVPWYGQVRLLEISRNRVI